jgi:hypothetical protein
MKLSTPVSISKNEVFIEHQTPLLFIGSCFAENIGKKLIDSKFDVQVNPHGIVFNPISVTNSLTRILNNQTYTLDDLKEHDNKWFSFEHHSHFSAFDRSECLAHINHSLAKAHEHLKRTKTIFITFGSAWVYETENFGIVANCHKIPQKKFTKRLLTVQEILMALETIKERLKAYRLVFTVSPVRHIKDGLHENNLSKSTLLLAINNWVEQNENSTYFPAYEFLIDELRDYRFYKDDLVHPTALAINYVWEKFSETYFEKSTQDLISEIEKIKTAAKHRPFHFESEAHQSFIQKQLQLVSKLSKKHPFLDFKLERETLKKRS